MKREEINSTCWEYVQGLREKPCCSACPACNCHKEICENCKYWYTFSKPEVGRWGACHKYAPRDQNQIKFPEITRDDFCGEFKPK